MGRLRTETIKIAPELLHRTPASAELTPAILEDYSTRMRAQRRREDSMRSCEKVLRQFYDFLPESKLVTRDTLQKWREQLLSENYAIRTVNSKVSMVNTKYAGHFTLGIIVYLILNKHERSALYFFEIPMCFLLIYRNIWSYTTWIRAIYEKLPYSDVELLIATLAVIGLFLTCVNLQAENKHYLNIIRKLSVLTFPYYLIHADLGYFIRTQYYNRLVPTFPGLLSVVNESMLMATGILCSLGLAWLLNQVEKRLLKL